MPAEEPINPIFTKERKIFNPFPGLRPFTIEESHLFFGREGQSDEMLEKLSKNRFVAVIGASGSGKSSLMYCGLVPILHGGFITEAGSQWRIITTRPGQSPVLNLSHSLVTSEKEEFGLDGEEQFFQSVILSTLRSSSMGLVDALKQLRRPKDQNFLVLVDQFEELFRFKRNKNDLEAFNESLAYVKLILTAIDQSDIPVYVVMTMRSDFIGDCSQFQELTKMINLSHYLIPQMTRDNLYEAITGPVAVGGGKISSHLVQQLLNDVGDHHDQLPILQHALMRTWDYWEKLGNFDDILDIKHYDDIGRMEKALSMHANEAFDELDHRLKELCESMFKTLTEKGGDNRGIRHPSTVEEIAAIALATPEEIIEIAEIFRAPGRSFLAPSIAFKLNPHTVLDISHESLMRIWDKLRFWVDEEASSVQMYLRLADAAERYQEGKTGLWRQPDLQLAINWKEKQKPTLVWAQRYHPAYERTIVYLETSEQAYIAEEEIKIKLQKRTIRRTRIFAAVLGTAAFISLLLMFYSFEQTRVANTKTIEADLEKKEAEKQKITAEKQREIAEEQSQLAIKQTNIAEVQRKLAEKEQREALRQKEIAQNQEQIAYQKSKEAEEQKKLAEENARKAKEQEQAAIIAKDEALNLRMLSISKSMAVKSIQIESDLQQKALVAYQAFKFNQKYGGESHNSDIYNGLYFAMKAIKGEQIFSFRGHTNSVRSVAFNPIDKTLYSTSSDGKLMAWNRKDSVQYSLILNNPDLNRTMVISNDGKWLANASGIEIQLINLTTTPYEITRFSYHKQTVWALAFSNNSQILYSTSADKTIQALTISTLQTQVIAQEKIKTVVVSPDNSTLACTHDDGSLVFINLTTNELTRFIVKGNEDGSLKLQSVVESSDQQQGLPFSFLQIVFNKTGTLLASGDKNGNIMVWNSKTLNSVANLTGHNARINDLKFSPSGNMLASASADGSVKLWLTNDYNAQPITLRDHEAWAMSIDFNSDGSLLYCGFVDGFLQYWNTNSKDIGDQSCDFITRNMTLQEWEVFVARDILYQKTCENLNDQ